MLCNSLCLSCFAVISLVVDVLFFFFLVPRDCCFSLPLPRGAVGWSAVFDRGISLSYSLFANLTLLFIFKIEIG